MKIKRIAHRGFSSEAPENTQASFAMAVEGDFMAWNVISGNQKMAFTLSATMAICAGCAELTAGFPR